MRSFSGLHFVLRVLSPILVATRRFLPQWSYEAILFSSAAMLIALVRPYKKMYMNVLDSLLLALLTMICHLLSISDSPYYLTIRGIEVFTISLIPGVTFWLYLIFKVVFKLWKQLKCYSRIKTLKTRALRAHTPRAPCNCVIVQLGHMLSPTITYARTRPSRAHE